VLSRRVLHHQFLGYVAGAVSDEFFLERVHAAGRGDHDDISGQAQRALRAAALVGVDRLIVTVVGLGYAFDYIAIAWLLWAGLVCEIGILIFSRQIPHTEVVAHHTDSQPIKQIVLQRRVLALLGACFLMSVAHGPYYTFYSIYLVEHGYAKSSVGGLWALGVICEIAVFFVMPWLFHRYGYTRILLVSFACAVARFLMIAWCVDFIVVLLIAQILHAATFGAYHAASVGLIHEPCSAASPTAQAA
jgi:PPP family 3-phenylpropionic acid transporter